MGFPVDCPLNQSSEYMILIRYIRYYMSVLNYQNTLLYCITYKETNNTILQIH